MYEGIGKGFSASFGGRSEIKAAYRLFDNNLVNPDKILDPHYTKTLEPIFRGLPPALRIFFSNQ